jgi:hypothetical protein
MIFEFSTSPLPAVKQDVRNLHLPQTKKFSQAPGARAFIGRNQTTLFGKIFSVIFLSIKLKKMTLPIALIFALCNVSKPEKGPERGHDHLIFWHVFCLVFHLDPA